MTPISLPSPVDGAPLSVFKTLQMRKTTREIGPEPLPLQLLSDLLWAAYGVNRRRNGPFGLHGRTAASASNSQEIDLYVALREGAYLYDAVENALLPAASGDLRATTLTPRQQVSSLAPVQLIYVVDVDRLAHTSGFPEPGLQDPEVQKSYYFVDTGLIAANVYLFAAAEGLAAWFHNCDKDILAQRLKLGPSQRVLFAQSVGFPAKH